MKTKKIILFIVEGVSERTALALILSKLIQNENIRFHIVNGDITSDKTSNVTNVLTKVNEQIKKFIDNNFIKKSDILKVIHLTDMDGAYVGREFIEEGEHERFLYTENSIKAKSIDLVLDRNYKKSSIVNKLHSCTAVSNIPYIMYYFSCNLEHVLHNECNVPDDKKDELAEKFSDEFYGKEIEFVEFISNEDFAVSGNFTETWDFIKKENNSLKRHCNFHLFFK
jgi:hypothetical protein